MPFWQSLLIKPSSPLVLCCLTKGSSCAFRAKTLKATQWRSRWPCATTLWSKSLDPEYGSSETWTSWFKQSPLCSMRLPSKWETWLRLASSSSRMLSDHSESLRPSLHDACRATSSLTRSSKSWIRMTSSRSTTMEAPDTGPAWGQARSIPEVRAHSGTERVPEVNQPASPVGVMGSASSRPPRTSMPKAVGKQERVWWPRPMAPRGSTRLRIQINSRRAPRSRSRLTPWSWTSSRPSFWNWVPMTGARESR